VLLSGTYGLCPWQVLFPVYRQVYVQPDCERGSLAHPTVDLDRTLMPFDDAIRDREPQAGPLSKRFGREERAEDLVDVLRGNTMASVFHLDQNRLPGSYFGSCRARSISSCKSGAMDVGSVDKVCCRAKFSRPVTMSFARRASWAII